MDCHRPLTTLKPKLLSGTRPSAATPFASSTALAAATPSINGTIALDGFRLPGNQLPLSIDAAPAGGASFHEFLARFNLGWALRSAASRTRVSARMQ